MKKIRQFATAILIMSFIIISSVCFADLIGYYYLNYIRVTMPEPEKGVVVPFSLEATANARVENIVWKDSKGNAISQDEILKEDTYTIEFDLVKDGGDRFSSNTDVYFNDSTKGVIKKDITPNSMKITKTFEIVSPALGGKQTKSNGEQVTKILNIDLEIPKIKLRDELLKKEDITINEELKDIVKISRVKWYQNEKEIGQGDLLGYGLTKLNIELIAEKNYVISKETNVFINGKKVAIKELDNSFVAEYEVLINEVSEVLFDEFEMPQKGQEFNKNNLVLVKDFPGTIESLDWFVEDENTSGEKARLYVRVKLKEGYIFDSPNAYINEKEQDTKSRVDDRAYGFEWNYELGMHETESKKWSNVSDWAVEEINKADEEQLIPEIFDNQDLTKNITRKEFAHVAVKLYEKISKNIAKPVEVNPFTDTSDVEVLKAYNIGITAGMDEDKFEPYTLITREQMATMMMRALSKANIKTTIEKDYLEKFVDDDKINEWAREAVYYMANIGIIKGTGDNEFSPEGNATREQAILISIRSAERFAVD